MADRLKFAYVRRVHLTQSGVIHVDVKDPTDYEEIVKKLKDRDFAEFLPIESEYDDDDNWSFAPILPEEIVEVSNDD